MGHDASASATTPIREAQRHTVGHGPGVLPVVARIGSPRWNSTFTQTTGSGTMWLATDAGPFEIDPLTNRVVGRLALAGDMVFGSDSAFLDGSLWIHDAKSENLIRLDVPAG